MNVTESMMNAIKANDEKAKANEKKVEAAKVRAAVLENPWNPKHLNCTRQCMIGKEFPELADVLKAHPAYTVPEMFDLLPPYAQQAIGTAIDGMKRDGVEG